MKTKLLLLLTLTSLHVTFSQEILTFSQYNGETQTLTANTATVNDAITIVFEDLDIINNFYTGDQTYIHLFGGLQINGTNNFQGSPTFTDLVAQPKLTLIASDTDPNSPTNTYSLTINLSQYYTGVSDGQNITGFNLLFQNQYGGGGNNQTVDLFINLVDALKNSTLSNDNYSKNSFLINLTDNTVKIEGLEYNQKFNLDVYDLNGKLVKKMNEKSNLTIKELVQSVYILKLTSENSATITKKVVKI